MSQEEFFQDIKRWDQRMCSQNFDKLPVLIKSVDNNEHQIEVLQVLFGPFFRCIDVEDLEATFLQPICSKVKTIYDDHLKSIIHFLSAPKENDPNIASNICAHLQNCLEIISCLELCTGYLQNLQDAIRISSVMSLPFITVHILHTSFKHCKESNDIYGPLFKTLSDPLSSFFKKAHSLQFVFLDLLTKLIIDDNSTENEVQSYCSILSKLQEISKVVSTLDVKAMLVIWKSISKFATQHKNLLCNDLDIDAMVSSLCLDMITSYKYIYQIIPKSKEQMTGDQKAFSKNIKVLGIQTKLLVSLVKTYSGLLSDCIPVVYEFCITVQSLLPPSISANQYNSSSIEEIQTQIGNGIPMLISCLVAEVNFANCATSLLQDCNEPFSRLMILLTVMDLLHTLPEETQNHWMNPNLLPEDTPRASLIKTTFSLLKSCNVEFRTPVMLSMCKADGNLPRSVNLYEFVCTKLCAFLASVHSAHFSIVEQCLLEHVLDRPLIPAFIATDVWCFLARYGSADLCQEHCFFLAMLLKESSSSPAPQMYHLLHLIHRLAKFLSPEHQSEFIQKFPVNTNQLLWSALPVHTFGGHVKIAIMEKCFESTTSNLLALSKDNIKPADLLLCTQCLQSIYNILCCGGDDAYCKSQLPALLSSCLHCIEVLPPSEEHSVLSDCVAALLNVMALLVSMMEKSHIMMVLKWIHKHINLHIPVKLASLNFLLELGKVPLSSTEDSQILERELPSSFCHLLSDPHPLVQTFSLQTFALFAETTCHEEVVPRCLQESEILQENVVSYLNQLANDSLPEVGNKDYLQSQANSIDVYLSSNIGDLFPKAEWSHFTQPQQKKVKLNATQQCKSAVEKLKDGLLQLQESASSSMPADIRAELQDIYLQLGAML